MMLHTIGLIIVISSIVQGLIVVFSKGGLKLQSPQGGFISWIYNILNLLILIVITPLIGILLLNDLDHFVFFTSFTVAASIKGLLFNVGLTLYLIGNIWVCWSRLVLWNNFRLGAVKPDKNNKLKKRGPFRFVRHPMYSGVILMTLGLTILLQSPVLGVLTIVLFYSIISMIPVEEAQLIQVFDHEYERYKHRSKALFPWLY